MLKEKCQNAKQFIKEHKKEILLGTICIGTAILVGKNYKHKNDSIAKVEDVNKVKNLVDEISKKRVDEMIRVDRLYDIANNSLTREESNIMFEMEELEAYIANLDNTKNINIFHRIPEKEKRINELAMMLKDVQFEKEEIHDIMSPIWD